jgi:hypothetical protein
MNENDDENLGPGIHLPEEEEFLEIIKRAVMESKLYEPFSLLENRVLHSISIEKVPPLPEFDMRQDDRPEIMSHRSVASQMS